MRLRTWYLQFIYRDVFVCIRALIRLCMGLTGLYTPCMKVCRKGVSFLSHLNHTLYKHILIPTIMFIRRLDFITT